MIVMSFWLGGVEAIDDFETWKTKSKIELKKTYLLKRLDDS